TNRKTVRPVDPLLVMSVNIPGIVSVALFYVAILILGVIAGRKTSKNSSKNALLVADRSLNLFVSVFTVT
ncbi:CDP-diacylglycerol-serine O-phosphatidyltransferase, partial [Biomphalaria glabrata]